VKLILVWTIIGAALGLAAPVNPLGLTNDGAQYLSGARNLQSTGRFATSILYFDEHYQSGQIPAPQTVWPPGYSAVLAGLGEVGVSERGATRMIGVLSLAATLGLTFLLGLRLTGSPLAGSLAALWVAGITELLFYVRTPNTDLPFVALTLAALAMCAGARPAAWPRWILAGLLVAAAMYFRYAGVFLFPAVGGYALYQGWHSAGSWRAKIRPILALLPGAALIAGLMLRNFLLVGSAKGGNTKSITQSLTGLIETTVIGFVDGLGATSLSDFRAGGWTAGLAAMGAVALALMLAAALVGTWSRRRLPWGAEAGLVASFALVYTAGVIAVSRGTMLTFGLRYLLPVLPCLVVLLVAAAWSESRLLRALTAAAAVLATVAGSGAYQRRWEARAAQAPKPDQRLLEWAGSRGRRPAPVLAVGISQATALELGGSVLIVPRSYFTARPWTVEQLREVVTRYGVTHVIAATDAADEDYPGAAGELLRGIAPEWLERVTGTDRASVYLVKGVRSEP
jgi:hypothetical protein